MFAIPILYTMESWWLGYTLSSWLVLLYVSSGLVLGWLLNLTTATDDGRTPWRAPEDAVEALAIGIGCSALTLLLIGELDARSSAIAAVRQVLLLAVPVSVGATVSRAQLGEREGTGEGTHDGHVQQLLGLGKTMAGAVVLGFPAAATEEIRLIAGRLSGLHLAGIVVLSVTLIYVLVFVAGFRGQSVRVAGEGHGLLARGMDTVGSFGIALVVSAALLAFLGFAEGEVAPREALAMVIVLSLPTAVGAAAGRLIS